MFKLPDLPYDFSALEPSLDARTMEIHHGKHHAAYVANLNQALESVSGELASEGLDGLLANLGAVPEAQRSAVRNHGGGHWNHSFFWESMGPGKGGAPEGDLAGAIDQAFGGFEPFKALFEQAAMGRFGSGWAWLSVYQGALGISSTANQDNPLMDRSGIPLLGLDVWEHAYYLKYQNRRADYVKSWWDVVDWQVVAKRYGSARR
jgi:Fe-Mn family superoxide dismutase